MLLRVFKIEYLVNIHSKINGEILQDLSSTVG
jgi:hypothetical protein